MENIDKKELFTFLNSIDGLFPVPLSNKVDLQQYAEKLLEKGQLCIERRNGEIVGLVAGYTENLTDNMAYISLVGTSEKAQNQGIATKLIKEFCDECRKKNIERVHLYTDIRNSNAIYLYEKIGFKKLIISNEPRKEDLHLVMEIPSKLK